MTQERFELPKPIMDASNVEQEIPNTELRELFGVTLPAVVKLYEKILAGEGNNNIQRAELAKISSDELARHLDELVLLERTLQEFAQNPKDSEIRSSGISQDEQSYRVRVKLPSAAPMGETPETSQTQLSLYARITSTHETRDQAISAASIRGLAPEQALKQAAREFSGGQVLITTLGVLRSRNGEYLVIPRAGIELVKDERFVDLNGLKPVGQHFHRLAIDNFDEQNRDLVSLDHYQLLHNTITQMSGVKKG